jgi:hypothetical protein
MSIIDDASLDNTLIEASLDNALTVDACSSG